MSDLKNFGRLVREKRTTARLSQEAVAALAFGNANRKGYISALETGAKAGIKPQTVQRLADALDISRQEIPQSLRWPIIRDQDRADTETEQTELSDQFQRLLPLLHIVEELERSSRKRVARTPLETYRERLSLTLEKLTRLWGDSFSGRSFAMSLTLAYIYIFFAGVLAYAWDGGTVGALDVFERPGWAKDARQPQLAWGIAFIVILTCLVGFRLGCRPARAAPFEGKLALAHQLWRRRRVRVIIGGALLGCSAVAASHMGVDPVVASIVVVIFGLIALADLGPRRAGLAGAIAGTLAGLIENLATHQSVVRGLEGALFGLVLGGASFYVGTKVAQVAPTRGIAGITGAGVGICTGAVVTMGFFALLDLLMPGEAAVPSTGQAFDLLAPQDRTFVVLAVIWVMFPFANALQDFLSYGISRSLASRFLKRDVGLGKAIFYTILDLSVSACLALTTLASIFAALWVCDQIFHLDLAPQGFVSAWWAAPFAEGLWLSAMIASTLSWSLLHYACVILPTASAHLASGKLFQTVAKQVRAEETGRRFGLQTYALSLAPTAFFLFAYVTALILSLSLALWGLRLAV